MGDSKHNLEVELAAICNSLDDAIVCVDETQRVIFLNSAAEALLAWESCHGVGQPLTQCPTLARFWAAFNVNELLLGGGGSRVVRRLEGTGGNGERFPLEATLRCVEVPERRLLVLALRDLSWPQQMEQAVAQARKHQALGALSSGIAHDFNNVLTGVISQLDLALHSRDCPQTLKANLNYALASARRGAEVVSKLQIFNRQTRAQVAPVNPQEMVDLLVFILRHSVDPRLEIRSESAPTSPWWVNVDYAQMLHALVNLGLNAQDAMPQGGVLSVRIDHVTIAPVEARPPRGAGDFVRISLTDTGREMSAEMLARLSDPGVATREGSRGLALGLSTTSAIVGEHGGWIEAESRPGSGNHCDVYLPRVTEPASAARPPEVPLPDPKRLEGRERILVADDDEAIRTVIRTVLGYRGYEVVEACDGEDAVAKYGAAAKDFDLVLMDLHMPRMSGRDALRRIRDHDPKAKLVLLSGTTDDVAEASLGPLAQVRFLPKPFQNEELVELVRHMLDQR